MGTPMRVHHEEVDGVGTDVEHTGAHRPRLLRRRDAPVTCPVVGCNGIAPTCVDAGVLHMPTQLSTGSAHDDPGISDVSRAIWKHALPPPQDVAARPRPHPPHRARGQLVGTAARAVELERTHALAHDRHPGPGLPALPWPASPVRFREGR
jgi:hypothetical protein